MNGTTLISLKVCAPSAFDCAVRNAAAVGSSSRVSTGSLVFVSVQAPLGIWLFRNYCKELPREPEEAALIDGCTRWQAFRRVVLPQMRSGIAALGAIFMLAVWGEFLIPLLLSSTLNTKSTLSHC